MTANETPSADGTANERDPETVMEDHEQQLSAVLAEVDEPTAERDAADANIDLAGLELGRRDLMKAGRRSAPSPDWPAVPG